MPFHRALEKQHQDFGEESQSHLMAAATPAAPQPARHTGCQHAANSDLGQLFSSPPPSVTYLQVIRVLGVEMYIKLRKKNNKPQHIFFIPVPNFDLTFKNAPQSIPFQSADMPGDTKRTPRDAKQRLCTHTF